MLQNHFRMIKEVKQWYYINWHSLVNKKVGRYQRGNQNPYIEEETTQWPKEKLQKDKQRSTKYTHKTNDRVTRTPLKTGGVLWKGKQ